jgi:Ca2+-transporting ATPase
MLPRSALSEITGDAALLTAVTLGAQAIGLARHGVSPHAATLAFSTLTTAQLVHTLRYRAAVSDHERGARSRVAPVVLGSLGAQLAAMAFPPLRRLLGITALPPADWLVVAAGALTPAAFHEARRRLAPSP